MSSQCNLSLRAPKSSVLSEGVNVEMIPSIDGIEFASELQVDNWFSISDIITLKDEKNEKLVIKNTSKLNFLKSNPLMEPNIFFH